MPQDIGHGTLLVEGSGADVDHAGEWVVAGLLASGLVNAEPKGRDTLACRVAALRGPAEDGADGRNNLREIPDDPLSGLGLGLGLCLHLTKHPRLQLPLLARVALTR